MRRRILKKKMNLGTAPGTLVKPHTGELPAVRITRFTYNKDHLEEQELDSIEEAVPKAERSSMTWINVEGVHNVEILHRIGELYNIHPLILEDIQNTGQRPKMDQLEGLLFVCLKMLRYG